MTTGFRGSRVAHPSTALTAGRLLLGLALMALAVEALRMGGFAPNWQPMPKTLPLRWLLADFNAALLLAFCAALVVGWRLRTAALGLSLLIATWILALHAPGLIAHPLVAVRWLAVAELGALAAGGAILAAAATPEAFLGPRLNRLLDRAVRPARFAFGLCLLVFGASHFIYAGFTAQMVPGWLPDRMAWAYGTGAAHVAAGLATLSGVLARRAAQALGLMFLGFIALVHIPRVLATHGDRMEVLFLTTATALLGSACLLIAGNPRHGAPPSGPSEAPP